MLTTTQPRPAPVTTRITVIAPARQRPARARRGLIYDFDINGMAGQLHVTELADGRPGEIFLHIGKHGSTLRGLCEALSITTSLALQHHTPLPDIVHRLANLRFEPAGTTGDPDIPICTSIADYLARRLAADYLPAGDHAELGLGR